MRGLGMESNHLEMDWKTLFFDGEDVLLDKVQACNHQCGYTRYTSTLREAWRQSIAGLVGPFCEALEQSGTIAPVVADEDVSRDPGVIFGLREAEKHRARGVDIGMFLGSLKAYRQGFLNFVAEVAVSPEALEEIKASVNAFFDRVEIGICNGWLKTPESHLITEMQQTNLSLANEKNKFLTIFESLPTPAWFVDSQGLVAAINLAAAGLFSSDHSPGSRYYNDVPMTNSLEWLQADLGAFHKSGESERIFDRELQDGRHFEVKLRKTLDISGKFVGTVVTLNNITPRIQAQKELAKLSRAVEQCPVSIVITDPEGGIEYVNPKFCEITGYSQEESIGQNPRLLKSGDMSDDEYRKLWETITSGKEWRGEFHNKRKDGELYWEYASISPIRNAHGDITHYVAVKEDITQRKRLEESLQTEKDELEDAQVKLQRAYTELQDEQEKILQQEKMATIGQLAAGVAHEINNPIGFIGSNLTTLTKYLQRVQQFMEFQNGLLKAENQTEIIDQAKRKRQELKIDFILDDSKALLEESHEGIERVKKIVQDLKSFSRVDQSECKLSNINDCVESTINIVWNEIKYKANLTRDYGDIPLLKCYPQQLNQVFMNLLVNAAQAIDKDGEILARTSLEGDTVVISISDSGKGIPEDVLQKVFEPFFTTKPVGVGTGLGLSISYDIVKKHGGEMTVESRPGEGTCFTIRLPLAGVE